jgi:hypothetical protein
MALSVRLRLCRPATRPSYGWRLCTDGLSLPLFWQEAKLLPALRHLCASASAFYWKHTPPFATRVVGHAPKTMGFPHPHSTFFFFAENRLVAMNIWASAHRADVAATLCPCGLYVHRLTDESIGPRSGAAAAAWSISLLVN